MKHLHRIAFFWGCLVGLAAVSMPVQGQKPTIEKALGYYNGLAYGKAIESFIWLKEQGADISPYYEHLAEAYFHTAAYEQAAEAYAKLFAKKRDSLEEGLLHRYAISARTAGNFATADSLMQVLVSRDTTDQRGQKYERNRDYLKVIEDMQERYRIKLSGFNSSASDFGPAFWADSMVFSSSRDTGMVVKRRHLWNNQPFLDLYRVSLAPVNDINRVRAMKSLNRPTHESTATFTRDGETVYFTRNNTREGAIARDSAGISRLKIYRAHYQDGKWSEPEELPINGEDFSTAHPALNRDGTILYFASDRPGGYGGSDLYRVLVKPDGKLGEPENLGPDINTEGREGFPFCSDKGVLYFASDGHPGLGGLDIFATELIMGGEYLLVNLGKPVNGHFDDFSFIIDEKRKRGFFASNRPGGMGMDDIYEVRELSPLIFGCFKEIEGFIISSKDGTPIPNASIGIYRDNGDKLGIVPTGSPGRFRFLVTCGDRELTAIASHPEYKEGRKRFLLDPDEDFTTLSMPLRPVIKRAVQGTDLAKYLSLKPIYFDTNKSSIRADAEAELKKILAYLQEYRDSRISIRAHTDSRGNDDYNMKLSERRAQATRIWLIRNGISPNRITARGFGETQLLNDCGNGTSCALELHDENRRSEFIVTN